MRLNVYVIARSPKGDVAIPIKPRLLRRYAPHNDITFYKCLESEE